MADRVLHFVRHGVQDASTGRLTARGREQAELTAAALGIAPELWAGLVTYNRGISSLFVRDDGPAALICFNDSGHLPPELRIP